ncbi:MAG: hypothetical protein RL386_104 [Bacteroidota bacterium]
MRVISLLLLCTLLLSGCAGPSGLPHTGQHFILNELDKGVYAGIHRFGGTAICNVGVVDNGDATIIFDAFLSPDAATALVAEVQRMGLSPIRYVVNSHHHNDHVRGNQVFGPEVKIISTRTTAETMATSEPLAIAAEKGYASGQFEFFDRRMREFKGDTNTRPYLAMKMMRPYFEELSKSHEKIKTRLPDVFVEKEMDLSGSKRAVKIIDMGNCHSASDLVMVLPKQKILFSGDIVFNAFHPYLADGDVDRWRAALRELDRMDFRQVVPGHGDAGSKVLCSNMIAYIDDLEALAREMAAKGGAPAIPAVPAQYASWWLENFYADNLKFLVKRVSSNKSNIHFHPSN